MSHNDLSRLNSLRDDLSGIEQQLKNALNDMDFFDDADAEGDIKSNIKEAQECIEIAISDCDEEIDKIENPQYWEDEESEDPEDPEDL